MTVGNITKITRTNSKGVESVRYRYRLGRKGQAKSFKTKAEAQEHQKQVERATKSKGSDALKVLDKETLGHVVAALELLEAQRLGSEHLLQACRGYTASISEHALTVTLGDAVAMAMETPRFVRLKTTTTKDYRYRWRRLVEHLGASKPLGSVTVFDIERFIASQSINSQYKYYANLHVLFGAFFVRQLRLLSDNIADKVIPPEKAQGQRRDPYTYPEVVTILDHVDPYSDLDILLHLSLFTGMRTSEVCNLTHDMFNLSTGEIYLPYGFAKNKMDRFVKLPEALLEFITRAGLGLGEGLVITRPYRYLGELLKTTCEACEVPYKGVTTRITYISHAYQGLFNKELQQLQFQVGHSINSQTTLRHYVNAVNQDDLKPYFLLPLKRVDEQMWSVISSPV